MPKLLVSDYVSTIGQRAFEALSKIISRRHQAATLSQTSHMHQSELSRLEEAMF